MPGQFSQKCRFGPNLFAVGNLPGQAGSEIFGMDFQKVMGMPPPDTPPPVQAVQLMCSHAEASGPTGNAAGIYPFFIFLVSSSDMPFLSLQEPLTMYFHLK